MSAWTNDMHARAREATGLYYPDSLHKAFLIHALDDEIERLRAENAKLTARAEAAEKRASDAAWARDYDHQGGI